MKQYLELGSAPPNEPCVQLGDSDYPALSTAECSRYRQGLERRFKPTNPNNWFATKSFTHDFGLYREVVVYFDDTDQSSIDFAFNVDANLPSTWSEL